jgi:hypothetical protein
MIRRISRIDFRINVLGRNVLSLIYQKDTFVCLFICFVSLIIYGHSLQNQFQTDWDDQYIVFNQYTTSGLNTQNLINILTESYAGQYAPINQLYYTLLYSLDGYNPFLFHFGSLVLHILNLILVYFLLKRLLLINQYLKPESINRIAFYTIILMSVHPILIESVAWVSASKVVLYVFFYLIALNYYINYSLNKGFLNYCLALFFFALSFGSKEQAVTLPLCLLLFDLIVNRELSSRHIWIEKIPFFILAIIFGMVTIWSQKSAGTGLMVDRPFYPFYQNIAFAAYALWLYIFKCVIPYPLSYLYPFPIKIGQGLPIKYWFPLFNILLAGLYFQFLFKIKWLFYGFLFFLIHIVVVLHIVPISRLTIIADRYVYLSAVGLFFILACFIEHYWKSPARYLKLFRPVFVLYIISMLIYSTIRTSSWYDSETIKLDLYKIIKNR